MRMTIIVWISWPFFRLCYINTMDHSEGSKGRGGGKGSDLVDQKNSRVTCILNSISRVTNLKGKTSNACL